VDIAARRDRIISGNSGEQRFDVAVEGRVFHLAGHVRLELGPRRAVAYIFEVPDKAFKDHGQVQLRKLLDRRG